MFDATINQYIFRFISHASSALDGDRGSMNDRMRNEMKTQTSAAWYKLNGNWGESQDVYKRQIVNIIILVRVVYFIMRSDDRPNRFFIIRMVLWYLLMDLSLINI